MSTSVVISAQAVPSSYCWASPQETLPFFASLLTAVVQNEASYVTMSVDVPGPEDEDKPWFRLNSDGTPDRMYVFANGSWIWPHPLKPGMQIMWGGDISTIDDFDGGASGTVTKVSGPMWQEVTACQGRVPLHPGALPVSNKTVNVGDTGGNDKINLIIQRENLPDFQLELPFTGAGGITIESHTGRWYADDLAYNTVNPTTKAGLTLPLGSSEPIETDITPPYYATYLIQRTNREFYRVP